MRIFFIGSTKFGRSCLERLAGVDEVEVVGVLTAPQQLNISYSKTPVFNVLHADFDDLAIRNDIPLYQLQGSMSDPQLEEAIFGLRPDMLLVAGWHHMVPKRWLERAPALGFHASLLPKYRGGAPLVWALIRGEKRTGVTLFQLDEGVDTGPVFSSRTIRVDNEDTIADVLHKVESKSLEIISQDFPLIVRGDLVGKPQPPGRYPIMPQRSPSDGLIDWRKPSDEINRFIRAQTKPYPGAYWNIDGQPITIWKASSQGKLSTQATPGTVMLHLGNFFVRTADGWLSLEDFSCEGSYSLGKRVLYDSIRSRNS